MFWGGCGKTETISHCQWDCKGLPPPPLSVGYFICILHFVIVFVISPTTLKHLRLGLGLFPSLEYISQSNCHSVLPAITDLLTSLNHQTIIFLREKLCFLYFSILVPSLVVNTQEIQKKKLNKRFQSMVHRSLVETQHSYRKFTR